MSDNWEEVCSNTWRLKVTDGDLYRVSDDRGTQMVYVPCNTISESLDSLAETLAELRQLFDETTFEVSGREGIRAIRNCDIGD
jgi:hypothetical protein